MATYCSFRTGADLWAGLGEKKEKEKKKKKRISNLPFLFAGIVFFFFHAHWLEIGVFCWSFAYVKSENRAFLQMLMSGKRRGTVIPQTHPHYGKFLEYALLISLSIFNFSESLLWTLRKIPTKRVSWWLTWVEFKRT